MLDNVRYLPFSIVVAVTVIALAADAAWWVTGPLLLLTGLGLWDLAQSKHSLFRNYPLVGHIRFLSEAVGPMMRQYFVEADTEGKPYDREQRSLVYQRAKKVRDSMPFGTERAINSPGYEWLNHSMLPREVNETSPTTLIGSSLCSQPYHASLFNISGMSFGALSAPAVQALNLGAKQGGFAQNTGEGGLSEHHLKHGGDVIWQIGTGYFGCRNDAGRFDVDMFKDRVGHPSVKMIEVKLSQGAKPGHGGILPAAKVNGEIVRARGVPEGEDCISPPWHREFTTPIEMLEFITKLRALSNGKPVGIKLCVGSIVEVLALTKAIQETGLHPDFIVVDGAEGGTGAAPVEFSDHVGMPLRDGLGVLVNALVGTGLKNKISIGASGKIISGFDMAIILALGADWCLSARAYMFALGCLQSQACHTNHCPVGIATQDPLRARALKVDEKAGRVHNYHAETIESLVDLASAAGLAHPSDFDPKHFNRRLSDHSAVSLAEFYPALPEMGLVDGDAPEAWLRAYKRADASRFG